MPCRVSLDIYLVGYWREGKRRKGRREKNRKRRGWNGGENQTAAATSSGEKQKRKASVGLQVGRRSACLSGGSRVDGGEEVGGACFLKFLKRQASNS